MTLKHVLWCLTISMHYLINHLVVCAIFLWFFTIIPFVYFDHFSRGVATFYVSTGHYSCVVYDVTSGSNITPCYKIDKPLVVYRFSNV